MFRSFGGSLSGSFVALFVSGGSRMVHAMPVPDTAFVSLRTPDRQPVRTATVRGYVTRMAWVNAAAHVGAKLNMATGAPITCARELDAYFTRNPRLVKFTLRDALDHQLDVKPNVDFDVDAVLAAVEAYELLG